MCLLMTEPGEPDGSSGLITSCTMHDRQNLYECGDIHIDINVSNGVVFFQRVMRHCVKMLALALAQSTAIQR